MFFEEIIRDEYNDFFDDQPITPRILKDIESLDEFYNKLKTIEENHFDKLKPDLAATLYCLERYFLKLQKYILQFKNNQLTMIGSIVITDFQKFYNIISSLIYDEIGKSGSKLYMHSGTKWERVKKKYEEKLWSNSNLYGLMYANDNSKHPKYEVLYYLNKALLDGVNEIDMEHNEHIEKVQKILNRESNYN